MKFPLPDGRTVEISSEMSTAANRQWLVPAATDDPQALSLTRRFYSTMGSADGPPAAGVLELADNIVNVMTVNWGKRAQA